MVGAPMTVAMEPRGGFDTTIAPFNRGILLLDDRGATEPGTP